MSPWKKRPCADHQATADSAKATPGRWVLAGTYASQYSAEAVARTVRSGSGSTGPAYQPAGCFDARCAFAEDGTELWVRYLPNAVIPPMAEECAA